MASAMRPSQTLWTAATTRRVCTGEPAAHAMLTLAAACAQLLCLSLWDAAERPRPSGPLISDDRASWSLPNLRALSVADAAALQQHGGPRYTNLLQLPLALCSLQGVTNNISPYAHFIFAADKHEVVQREGAQRTVELATS